MQSPSRGLMDVYVCLQGLHLSFSMVKYTDYTMWHSWSIEELPVHTFQINVKIRVGASIYVLTTLSPFLLTHVSHLALKNWRKRK